MLLAARLRRIELDTKIGSVLNKKRPDVDEKLLENFSAVRLAARDPEELRRKGFSSDEVTIVTAFATLARVFPPDVAAALQDAGVANLGTLKAWPPERFEKALEQGKVDHDIVAYERLRFEQFRRLPDDGTTPNHISGITLDIADSVRLSDDDRAKLNKAGIETLADWPELRDRVRIAPAAAGALDAHARLSLVPAPPELVTRLIEQKLDSAFDLARLSDKAVKQLSQQVGATEESIVAVRERSRDWANQVAGIVLDTKIAIGGPSLDGLDVVGDLVNLQNGDKCVKCSEELSAFSRFAYFVYLLKLTNKSLNELEAVLRQGLDSITPDSGRDMMQQNEICIEVLSSANPQPLTESQKLPYERQLMVGKMRLLPLIIDEFAQQVAAVAGGSAASIAGRLRAALRAAPDAADPAFTAAELQAIANLLDQQLRARVELEVGAEPTFATATASAIAAEVDARVQTALEAVHADAMPLLRDAHKKRTGKNDGQLFDTFFIETDLPSCERLTRLDQAIRSLQAFLDKAKAGDESFSYHPYEAWRGDRIATFYPELRALWRDDVLAYESGAPDRGSIVFDHNVNNLQLRKDLDATAKIIKEAKARVESVPPVPPVSFREAHSVFYSDFERGFDALDQLLSANDDARKSLAALDAYEPGQALAHLSDAAHRLDTLAKQVFKPGSGWIATGTNLALYDNLAALPLRERAKTLEALFQELISGEKAIFLPRNASIAIAGLLPDGDLESLSTGWEVSAAFRLLDDGQVRKDAGGGSALRQVRYTAAGSPDFSNYMVKVDFELARQLANKDRIGLGARLGSQGDRGYRLLVDKEEHNRDDGDPLKKFFLRLERFDGSGSEELATKQIFSDGVIAVNHEHVPAEEILTLELHVYGTHLRGVLNIPGKKITVEADDGQFQTGTFALLAGPRVEADFSNLHLDFEGSGGSPPFYAHRRSQRGHGISNRAYAYRQVLKRGMALRGLAQTGLIFEAGKDTDVKLEGAKVNGKQLSLSFKEGKLAVSVQKLDKLFEKLMSGVFYLRYAVIPLRLAQAYQQAGDYARAVNILSVIYDDNGQIESQREVYPALSAAPETFTQAVGADSRLMRLRLGEAYLALAEWHFRKDTPESRYQARRLYERVLRLHTYRVACDCELQLGEFTEHVVEYVSEISEVNRLPVDVALDLIRISINTDIPIDFDRLFSQRSKAPLIEAKKNLDASLASYRGKVRKQATVSTLASKGASLLRAAELLAAARFGMGKQPLRRGFLADATQIFARDLTVIATIDYTFCIPEAPLKSQQTRTACHMLRLLRTCRNILGFSDEFLPPLRFEALLRLARSLTELALASERDLLNFRQQFEQESLSLLEAQNNLAVSEGELAVETMQVLVAESDVKIAGLQLEQASGTAAHLEGLIEAGLSSAERLALDYARWAATFSALSAATSVSQMGIMAVAGIATGGATTALDAAGGGAGSLSALSSAARDMSSAATMQAGFERRRQEWEFDLQQSRIGVSVAQEQLGQATMRFAIAARVQGIAALRRDFAMDTVQFLGNKFLSSAMWLALQATMRQQYQTRLNYAITAAFMAERALAFELQNRSLSVIRFDYFDPKRDGLLGATELQTDLATLENTRLSFIQRKQQLSKTISLAQMMPVEFEIFRNGADLGGGNIRPPGRLPFSTPMTLFDRDFPGHYMRLIKAVKVTVVALIPPNDGIRATLRNNGLSRVAIGPPYSEAFREHTIRRNPEAVALSLPFQATGLFVFDYNDDLLLPFEGSGVATDWIFELPTSANRFDYGTIADVLLTIEYTALESAAYREQVLGRLSNTFAADRSFSLRYEFPDAWYDLHHPDQVDAANRMKAVLNVRPSDFPPNLKRLGGAPERVPDITAQQIQLFVACKNGESFELPVGLKFKPISNPEIDAGIADTLGGLVSTRQPSGTTWGQRVIGKHPVGTWELDLTGNLRNQAGLPLAEPISTAFKNGAIEDILFVISYQGETLPMP